MATVGGALAHADPESGPAGDAHGARGAASRSGGAGGRRELPLERRSSATTTRPRSSRASSSPASVVPPLPAAERRRLTSSSSRARADDYATVAVAAIVTLESGRRALPRSAHRARLGRRRRRFVRARPEALLAGQRSSAGLPASRGRVGQRRGRSAERSPRIGGLQARDGRGRWSAGHSAGVGGGARVGPRTSDVHAGMRDPGRAERLWAFLMDVPQVASCVPGDRDRRGGWTTAHTRAACECRSARSACRSRAP